MNKIIKLNVIRRELASFTENLPPVVWCYEDEWYNKQSRFIRVFRDEICITRVHTMTGAKVAFQKNRFQVNTTTYPKSGTVTTEPDERGGDFSQRIVNNAVLKGSPHVAVVLQSHKHIKAMMEDIIKEAKHRGIPFIVYWQQNRISVGISNIHVSALDEDKVHHAGREYSSIFIDEPFEMHHSTLGLSNTHQAFLATRLRLSK